MKIFTAFKVIRQIVILFALCGLSFTVFASATETFNDAARLFKQKNYSAAIKKFKMAEKQGIKSVALYYNLASSYYRTGQYDRAREYFEKVKSFKRMKTIAEYNLGLIAEKQNNKTLAKQLYASVNKNSKDKKLRVLAVNRLNALTGNKQAKKWSAYIGLFYGNDDNVNFAPSGVSSNRSDNFFDFTASADYFISGTSTNGWLVEASYSSIDYRKENNSDETDVGVGIKKYHKINADWQSQYSVNYYTLDYAGGDYQTIIRLGAWGRKKLSRNERLYLRYRYDDISSENATYNYLQGTRQKFRVEYRQYNRTNNKKVYYELEVNNREDRATSSYSPTRHTVRGKYTWKFNPQWRLTADGSYRISAYPAKGSQNRNDKRIKLAAYLDYYFDRKTKLRTKMVYTDNNSNTNSFDYTRTVISVGVSRRF